MGVIGFRCETTGFRYVVLDGTKAEPVLLEARRCRVPVSYSRPAQLSWLRQEIATIIGEKTPVAVGYKKAESMPSGGPSTSRLETETVLQLAAHEAGVADIRGFVKKTLAKSLAFEGPARYIERAVGETEFAGLGKATEDKEAALAAWSLLPEV